MKITVVAIGTRGDVEPHRALCVGLMRAGYSVKLCAPADFVGAAEVAGIAFHPVRVSFRNLMQTPGGEILLASDTNGLRLIRQLRRLAAGVAGRIISGIREACEGSDAVCYSPLGVPAQFFAREMGIPSIATCMQPIAPTRERPSPLLPLPRLTPGWINTASYVVLEELFWQLVRPLLKPHVRGPLCRTGHFGRMWNEPSPILFAFSPSVVPKPADWKPWMHVTGYWTPLRDSAWRPPDSLVRFLAGGPPPLCIGFGSMNSSRIAVILDRTLQMLAQTGRRAVVLAGWSGFALQSPGENVYVMESAPHEWLFPRVSSVIHHGGAGTTAAALRAGVASVIVPFFFDQGFWARQMAAGGLGPAEISFRHVSAATLRSAVEAAEAPDGIRRRVQELSWHLREEDGVARAVEIIKDTIGEPRVVMAAAAG